jgi:katanin p60 ATPase-containing subunit A1
MSKSYSILDLSKIVKAARENCILGLYEKALRKYQIAIPIIQSRILDLSNDTLLQEKWKNVEKNLKEEEAEIQEIMKSCDIFKNIYSESGEKKAINVGGVDFDSEPTDPYSAKIEKDADMLRRLQGIEPEKKPRKNDKNGLDANEILNNVKMIQNISNQVEKKINNIQKNNDNDRIRKSQPQKSNPSPNISKNNDKKPQPQQPKYTPPQNYGGGHVGYSGGGRVNPMNLINDAINNHPANKKMEEKYGHLANLGPDGYVKGSGGGGYSRPSGGKNIGGGNKNAKGKDGKGGENGKSAFLLSRYPDGNGPDAELIEMLEREVVDTNPNVSFDDIAELNQAKKALQEAVLLPLIIPDYFKGIRRPWRGVLLYGPPGTGKTMLAKALATQGKTTFFNVHSSSFASKWRGESEKLVRILFEMARFYAPTTIFIDEVDSLCSKRGEGNEGDGSRRVKAELLVQMEGVNSNTSAGANEKSDEDKRKIVTVMAATNRPWDLDDALRRRFEKRVYIPLPNEKGRLQLFNLNLKKIEVDKNINYDKLVKLTDGYSGADISNVCREASFMPMRRELLANKGRKIEDLVNDQEFRAKIRAAISMPDFEKAIGNISKSVSAKDLEVYDKWTKEFSSV